MKIFASHNSNSTVRMNSSSGGVFTVFAEKVLAEDGVVYGAAYDDLWNVVHKRIDNVELLNELQGSKYVYSDALNVYSDVLNDLAIGKSVLFSGTPCQIAAMKKQAGNNENLMLVEVVCHGTPKPDYWQQYLKELCQKSGHSVSEISSITFRDKRTGWKNYSFTIIYKDGTEFSQLHGENPYMRAFLHNYTLRNACFRCPFKYPEGSCADITLGDLWGISHLAPEIENDLGTTLVIVRTEKGDSMLPYIEPLKTLTLDEVSIYNPAVTTSVQKPSKYDKFYDEVQRHQFIPMSKKFTKRSKFIILKAFILRIIEKFKHKL